MVVNAESRHMAIVTKYLFQLIAKQVDDRGLVVWYDPEQAYSAAAAELSLPNTTVARYNDSFLRLRKESDPLLNDGQPPRLVVYVPMERTETHSALIELDCAGVIMQPRQQPPACNTRLSVVARNALKPILGEDPVAEIERQVEAGKLSLADLNSLAEPLQVSMDNGARRALVPLENKRNFLEVSGDIVERVDPVFFSDPMTAAMKALGIN